MTATMRHTLLALFTTTIFVSAALLFVVQPMVGKMILPHLGGSSSIWTTCMLFFQTMLVLGYVYAHGLAQMLTPRVQIGVHVAVIALAAATSLPFELPGDMLQSQSAPALWLLLALTLAIGLPLFVVSSSAPLFQHWFGFTDHPDAEDPYYLYAASNVGSILALFGYPFVVERTFAVDFQAELWAWGFLLLGALAVGCGALVLREQSAENPDTAAPAEAGRDEAPPLTWWRRSWWLLITFIPSSLMLGVTDYLTTDLASVPLLWVVPLGFYLLSFIIVFARIDIYLWLYRATLPAATLLVLAATFAEALSVPVLVVVHIWLFFLFALYFHGELAADRPHTDHLTEFYIWMSVGGALGGVFNALLVPWLFDRTIEYQLVLAVGVAALVPLTLDRDDDVVLQWVTAIALIAGLGAYFWSLGIFSLDEFGSTATAVILVGTIVGMGIQFPRVQHAAVAVAIALGAWYSQSITTAITHDRSFFATYSVYRDVIDDVRVKVFSHGTTNHGLQPTEEEWRYKPVGYYHPNGPAGDVFSSIPHDRVAIAGLGNGGLATYAQPGTEFVFYEIDPVVEKLAREHFTYLDHCGERCSVEIGDARKLLERAKPRSLDILFMDAYNSDSVPTHLLTTQAVELYLSRIDEDGVIIFHVSNRHLDIESVVGSVAQELDLVARTRSYAPADDTTLAYGSTFVAVGDEKSDLEPLTDKGTWVATDTADVVWTDKFSNIVSVFEW